MEKEYPIINKKLVRKNKIVRKIQNDNRKMLKRNKGKFPKGKISKIIKFTKYIDLTENNMKFEKKDLNLVDAIKESELTGRSGNGFPTYKKILTAIESKKCKLLINAIECDPGLIQDEWLVNNKFDDILRGIESLKQIINCSECVLATKHSEIKEKESNLLRIHIAPDKYPMGEERILIKEVFGEEIAKEEIPSQKGILVLNVQTVISIGEISNNEFSINSRYITIADYTLGEGIVAKVKIGNSAQNIIEKTLGRNSEKIAYIGGGVMSAHKLQENDIIKETTNFVGYGEKIDYTQASKCKKCGGCTKNCPKNIDVRGIVLAKENDVNVDIKMYKPEECIRCGMCTYICHAGKNTMEIVNS